MEDQDIRWEHRFANYNKALSKLNEGVPGSPEATANLSDLEKEGLIQRFEYTHELAWNVMKDFLEYQGDTTITGSRDAIRAAFKAGLIQDGDNWMDTLKSRNLTSHTYNEDTANAILEKIIQVYHALFLKFQHKMESLRSTD